MPQTRNLQLIYYSRADLSVFHTRRDCPDGALIQPGLVSAGYFPPYSGSKCCPKCAASEPSNGGHHATPIGLPNSKVPVPG